MRLDIPQHMYDKLIQHCIDGLPNEACGFLGGRGGNAEELYLLDNDAASPVYFRPNDKQMLKALTDIDDRSMELVCIFHSHVASRAYPSPTDVREAHYPEAAYLIVSLEDREHPEAKAYLIKKKDWRDDTGEILEIEVVVSSK